MLGQGAITLLITDGLERDNLDKLASEMERLAKSSRRVIWVNPLHRVFYGIAGIVLGIVSFPTSNLGGFFIGMLLAMVGGAIAFAWEPGEPEEAAERSAEPAAMP